MSLNKQKGNMYSFVTHTWNPIKGECIHDCKYCYMKCWGKLPKLHLDEKALNDDLGKGNYIFVGSSTDIWADNVPVLWLERVVVKCIQHPLNKYLFQTKNPANYTYSDVNIVRPEIILGTTIETNRDYKVSKAPSVGERADAMGLLKAPYGGIKTMVTIEPIMDFDLEPFLCLLKLISPKFINIGADSQASNLPEPSWDKVQQLIEGIKSFSEINIKNNLQRLRGWDGR